MYQKSGDLGSGFSSVQFSCSVVSDSLQPHESQHTRPSCPSPTPGVDSDPCPSSWWCHPTISSSVVPFSYCPQSLPASGLFPMSQLFAWGGQNTGVSASASFWVRLCDSGQNYLLVTVTSSIKQGGFYVIPWGPFLPQWFPTMWYRAKDHIKLGWCPLLSLLVLWASVSSKLKWRQ